MKECCLVELVSQNDEFLAIKPVQRLDQSELLTFLLVHNLY